MSSSSLKYDTKQRGDETIVRFEGEVDERCNLSALTLAGSVTFDLAGVTRLNSEGVRRWANFVRGLDTVTTLTFVRCSVPLLTQLNMISGILGKGAIRSFYAPYYCRQTGHEEERLLTVEQVPDPLNPPIFPCEGGELELDDIPERYFAFLLD
jgi:hypothetical protein